MLGITLIGSDFRTQMQAQSQDALGHGYSRPARSVHGSPFRGDRPERDGGGQPAACGHRWASRS